ncbi:hypothetical protein WR25_08109 [Diploscapter pachys]|uniref:Uncharacterized protein n=1 Tax=Diploscapter pachys TaxID=2018661 RepID=A0A2A2JMA4_9BILA|nr:hypothetical protein WR25_08109 [Diploscapter pachys]
MKMREMPEVAKKCKMLDKLKEMREICSPIIKLQNITLDQFNEQLVKSIPSLQPPAAVIDLAGDHNLEMESNENEGDVQNGNGERQFNWVNIHRYFLEVINLNYSPTVKLSSCEAGVICKMVNEIESEAQVNARHCDYDELIRMFKWIERIQHRNFAKLSETVKTATCNEIAMFYTDPLHCDLECEDFSARENRQIDRQTDVAEHSSTSRSIPSPAELVPTRITADTPIAASTSPLSMYNQRQALLDVTASADNLDNVSGYEQNSYLDPMAQTIHGSLWQPPNLIYGNFSIPHSNSAANQNDEIVLTSL